MKRYYNEQEKKYFTLGNTMVKKEANGGIWVVTPTEEQLLSWGYTEVVEPVYEPTPIPIEQQYKDLVISKIRERYSTDDELALLRQRDVKTEEFAQYNTFCEACKTAAREEVETREEA